MAGEVAEPTKNSWYNPKNLISGVQRLVGTELDETELAQENVQGEILWVSILTYILGNSIGTANEKAGRKRLHLGPVYVW